MNRERIEFLGGEYNLLHENRHYSVWCNSAIHIVSPDISYNHNKNMYEGHINDAAICHCEKGDEDGCKKL